MTECRFVRPNPHHAAEDPAVVRRLISENPWGTLVSANNGELVASHYPVLLDEEAGAWRSSPMSAGPTRRSTVSGTGKFC